MVTEPRMDAIRLLTADHRKVEGLFEKFAKAKSDSVKGETAHQICTELKIHSMIEEELFYPALRGKISDDDLDEAVVEHDGAKLLINDIEAAEPGEHFYEAKVKVLQEEIEHHVREEEKMHGSIFSQARHAGLDLVALGEKMAARKQQLMNKAAREGLPPARGATLSLVEG